MITRTATGYRTSGRVTRHADQIVAYHGGPFDATMESTLGAAVRAASGATTVGQAGMFDGLHATGHVVNQPWTGACWASTVDPHGQGGHGVDVVDAIAPTGPLHLIGTSMGGLCATVAGSQRVDRLASLTLVSPVVDVLDLYDRTLGNGITGPIAVEIAECWGGSGSATRAEILAAVTAAGVDYDSLVTALTPVADRIWLVCADDDGFGLAPACEAFAAAVGLGDRAVILPAGGSSTHPAPYAPSLGWDQITTLRQVEAWS